MTPITAPSIKHLKQKVLLTDLCRHYNIELQADKNKLYGYCPFHEDSTLSLVINPSANHWKCMKFSCGGGDNIHFVMKLEKISFPEAVEKLQHFAIQNSSYKNKNDKMIFKVHHSTRA